MKIQFKTSTFPITTFLEGMNAGTYDLEHSKLTDCPYWPETMAAKRWWEGYHHAQSKAFQESADTTIREQ